MNEYTRVTEPLFFISGLSDIPVDVLNRAKIRGTIIHRICEAFILGLGLPDENTIFEEENIKIPYSEIEKPFNSFLKWSEEKRFRGTSKRFFCDKHHITGEIDLFYEENGEFVLVDLKTPAKESKTWQLQLSAYAHLARSSGYNIKRIEAVKLDKQGLNAKSFIYQEDFDTYLKCLDIYRKFIKDRQIEHYIDYL